MAKKTEYKAEQPVIVPELPQPLPNETEFYQLTNEETDWGSMKITRKNEAQYNIVNVSDNYTAKPNDRYIIAVGTAASTITLPESNIGKVYTIKNFSGAAVTIVAEGSKIDTFSSKSLSATFNAVTLVNGGIIQGGGNGSGWSIVSEI